LRVRIKPLPMGAARKPVAGWPYVLDKPLGGRGVLLNVDAESDVRCAWRQALLVVAGLITQLAGHHRWTWGDRSWRLEMSDDFERAAKDRQRSRGKIVLLQLWFGICDLNGLERLFGPSQFQRDQVFVGRFIAVDVIARPQLGFEFHFAAGAAFYAQPFGSRQAEDGITLCL
jgi:hypothetical protein